MEGLGVFLGLCCDGLEEGPLYFLTKVKWIVVRLMTTGPTFSMICSFRTIFISFMRPKGSLSNSVTFHLLSPIVVASFPFSCKL